MCRGAEAWILKWRARVLWQPSQATRGPQADIRLPTAASHAGNRLSPSLSTTMPGEVRVKKGSEINAPSGGQTEGMIRMNAITDLSDQICGTGSRPRTMFDHVHS
jgi:hypothetical protein